MNTLAASSKNGTKVSRFETFYHKLCEDHQRIQKIGNLSQIRESDKNVMLAKRTLEKLIEEDNLCVS